MQEVVNNNELVKSPDKSGLREGKRCYPSRRWSLIRGSSGKLHCLSYVCSPCQGLYLQCLFVSGFLSFFIFFYYWFHWFLTLTMTRLSNKLLDSNNVG